mmetsp:Transcript_26651/g.66972  ORF Transcript_26651/g.66972 Transcript_26651/m.66972 type:complete len:437 (-) Transcript_26651:8-1318(-)
MELRLLPALATALLLCLAACGGAAPQPPPLAPCDQAVDFVAAGALPDGQFLNTYAFNRVMQWFQACGGGKLVVPKGTYLLSPVELVSNTTLWLEEGATLVFTDDPSLCPVVAPLPSYGRGRDHNGDRFRSFLFGSNVSDIVIAGGNGTIDGQGQRWWAAHDAGSEKYTRPHLIEFMHSRNIALVNVTLRNSPFWTVHPYDCDGFTAAHVTILNPVDAPNTDGIDPDSSKNVVIRDSYFVCGDDGIAIKSGWDCFGRQFGVPTENVTISNLTVISPTSAGICIGSEMSGGVRNVVVRDCTFLNTSTPLRIKSDAHRGGYVTNIAFSNITALDCNIGIEVNDFYGDANPLCGNDTALPRISGLAFRHIRVANVAQHLMDMEGLSGAAIEGVVLDDVLFSGTMPKELFKCSEVHGTSNGVTPTPCLDLRDAVVVAAHGG